MNWDSVIIEADGGSRGNPGPSAYGAVLRDATSGQVIAEDAQTIGETTNNVAEYSGLIAGLKLAAQFAPHAQIEVRMDSKLVVEQMSGRWKIKHPGMKPLAMEAHGLAPFGTTYTWMPRAQNAHADRLANEALDGKRSGVSVADESVSDLLDDVDELWDRSTDPWAKQSNDQVPVGVSSRGWSSATAARVTLVLVRHGVTDLTREKRFSGGLGASNPSLNDLGRDQALTTAAWLAGSRQDCAAVIASPVSRAWETAEIIGGQLDLPLSREDGFAEMEFGAWDGLTYAEVGRRHPEDLAQWLNSSGHRPGGGESFAEVSARVDAALARVVHDHANQTVVVVSHVTPIKLLVARALGDVGLGVLYRMELRPASVSAVTFMLDESGAITGGSLRLFNALPQDRFSLGV